MSITERRAFWSRRCTTAVLLAVLCASAGFLYLVDRASDPARPTNPLLPPAGSRPMPASTPAIETVRTMPVESRPPLVPASASAMTLTVRVRDVRGAPVPLALIEADQGELQVHSAADGVGALTVHSARQLLITVTHEGYYPEQVTVAAVPPEDLTIEVVLAPAFSLRVRVVDEQRLPIVGMVVMASPLASHDLRSDQRRHGSHLRSAVTGSDGECVVRPLFLGALTLYVQDPARRHLALPKRVIIADSPDAGVVEIIARAAVAKTVTFVDAVSRAPVPGVLVENVVDAGRSELGVEMPQLSDEHGVVVLEVLANADGSLKYYGGPSHESGLAKIPAAVEEPVVALHPLDALRVDVIADDGTHVESCFIDYVNGTRRHTEPAVRQDGFFRVAGQGVGDAWRFRCRHDDYGASGWARFGRTAMPGGPITLTLVRQTRVRGRLVAEGGPHSWAGTRLLARMIMVTSPTSGAELTELVGVAPVADDGTFEISYAGSPPFAICLREGPAAVPVVLVVGDRGQDSGFTRSAPDCPLVVARSGLAECGDVRWRGTGRLVVTVRRGPSADALANLWAIDASKPPGPLTQFLARTDANGVAVFPALAPARYRLVRCNPSVDVKVGAEAAFERDDQQMFVEVRPGATATVEMRR